MDNKIEINNEAQNNIIQPSKHKKVNGKTVKIAALALCCSLVGGAIGAGGTLAADRLLSKPDRNISRFEEGKQRPDFMSNSLRRPDQTQDSEKDSEDTDSDNDQEQIRFRHR